MMSHNKRTKGAARETNGQRDYKTAREGFVQIRVLQPGPPGARSLATTGPVVLRRGEGKIHGGSIKN